MSKPSLLERCQGPGATDISTLVNRAQQTAENVCRDYSIYLLEKIQGIKELIAAHRDVETQTEDQGKCKAEELLLLETGLRRAVETLGRPFPISP
jgi:hypothetical protein